MSVYSYLKSEVKCTQYTQVNDKGILNLCGVLNWQVFKVNNHKWCAIVCNVRPYTPQLWLKTSRAWHDVRALNDKVRVSATVRGRVAP